MTVETKEPTVTFVVTPEEQSPITVEHVIPDGAFQAIRAYWLQWLAAQIVAEKLKRSQKSKAVV